MRLRVAILFSWFAGCTPGAPEGPTPKVSVIIERGTGAFEGMVHVPRSAVSAGAAAGQMRPPPMSRSLPLPTFVCTATEVLADQCPGLEHDPLPKRGVRVSAFWIDENEVSNIEYAKFLVATGYRPPHVAEAWAEEEWNWDGPTPPEGKGDHPAVLTSWYDAREYCAWRDARLPTEAEWHLAAHGPAGDEWAYPWGGRYEDGRMNRGKLEPPNYDDADGYLTTSPVGQYPAGKSRYGANDLFGNAWEWVGDLRMRNWGEVRFGDAATFSDPTTTTLGLYAGTRGFSYFADPRPNLGIGHNSFPVELRRKTSGFRCARPEGG